MGTLINGLCHVPILLNTFSRSYSVETRYEVTKFVYLFQIFLSIAMTTAEVILKFGWFYVYLVLTLHHNNVIALECGNINSE